MAILELAINVTLPVTAAAYGDGQVVSWKTPGGLIPAAFYSDWIANPGTPPAAWSALTEFQQTRVRRTVRETRVALSASTTAEIAESVLGRVPTADDVVLFQGKRDRVLARHAAAETYGLDVNWSHTNLRTMGCIAVDIDIERLVALLSRNEDVDNPWGFEGLPRAREFRIPYEDYASPAMVANLRDPSVRVDVIARSSPIVFDGVTAEIQRIP